MKLTSENEYPVPIATAYEKLADFDALEALMEGYGAKILNRSVGWPDGQGRSWRIAVGFRGMHRELDAQVAEVSPPEGYAITGESDGVTCVLRLTLREAGAATTSVRYQAELGARGLTARLMLQPMRLAQTTLNAKFHNRVSAFVRGRLGL